MYIRNADGYNEYYRLFNNYEIAEPIYLTSCTPAETFPARDDSRDAYSLDPYCPLPSSNLPGTEPRSEGEHPPTTPSQFQSELNAAADEVEAEERAQPNLLVYKDQPGWKYFVKPGKAAIYMQRVAERLRTKGVCATSWDQQGLAMKLNNDYSEYWALQVLGQQDEQGNHPIYRNFHSTYAPAHF